MRGGPTDGRFDISYRVLVFFPKLERGRMGILET